MNKKQKPIPKHFQDAFKALANALIVTESINWNISWENVRQISREIQRQFIKLDDIFSNDNFPLKSEHTIIHSLITEEHHAMDDFTFLMQFTERFRMRKKLSKVTIGSVHWGFTPLLAQNCELYAIGLNCLGNTALLGSYFQQKGLRFTMGISSDHAYLFVYIGDKVYITDGSTPQECTGIIESYDGYEIYIAGKERGHIHAMMMLFDFDRALLYEILENVELLRQVSLGNQKTRLETDNAAERITGEHKKVIERISWHEMQQRLFPDMCVAFKTHRHRWLEELNWVERFRFSLDFKETFDKWFNHTAGQMTEAKKNSTAAEKRAAVMPILRNLFLHKDSVMQYLHNGGDLDNRIDSKAQIFLRALTVILIDQEIFPYSIQYIETSIIQAWEADHPNVFLTDKGDDDTVK